MCLPAAGLPTVGLALIGLALMGLLMVGERGREPGSGPFQPVFADGGELLAPFPELQ